MACTSSRVRFQRCRRRRHSRGVGHARCELLRGSYQAASVLAGTVTVQITAPAWLMINLERDTRIDVTTIPAVS